MASSEVMEFLENSTRHLWENESKKGANNINIIMKIILISQSLLKGLKGPSVFPEPQFENDWPHSPEAPICPVLATHPTKGNHYLGFRPPRSVLTVFPPYTNVTRQHSLMHVWLLLLNILFEGCLHVAVHGCRLFSQCCRSHCLSSLCSFS